MSSARSRLENLLRLVQRNRLRPRVKREASPLSSPLDEPAVGARPAEARDTELDRDTAKMPATRDIPIPSGLQEDSESGITEESGPHVIATEEGSGSKRLPQEDDSSEPELIIEEARSGEHLISENPAEPDMAEGSRAARQREPLRTEAMLEAATGVARVTQELESAEALTFGELIERSISLGLE